MYGKSTGVREGFSFGFALEDRILKFTGIFSAAFQRDDATSPPTPRVTRVVAVRLENVRLPIA